MDATVIEATTDQPGSTVTVGASEKCPCCEGAGVVLEVGRGGDFKRTWLTPAEAQAVADALAEAADYAEPEPAAA